jgi:hypothetical protein
LTVDERERVLKILEDLNLPDGRWVLSGSGVMILNGLERHKPMGDLDIFVATRTWFDLLEQKERRLDRPSNFEQRVPVCVPKWEVFTTDPDDPMRRSDPPYLYGIMHGLEVNIFHGWRKRGIGDIDVAFWICNPEVVEGWPCIPLQFLLDWKQQVGRDKDQQDIKLLREHLFPIRAEDLQVDVYSAGVNASHVRITHMPTGIVAECGEFASQIANREYAIERLREKLIEDGRR